MSSSFYYSCAYTVEAHKEESIRWCNFLLTLWYPESLYALSIFIQHNIVSSRQCNKERRGNTSHTNQKAEIKLSLYVADFIMYVDSPQECQTKKRKKEREGRRKGRKKEERERERENVGGWERGRKKRKVKSGRLQNTRKYTKKMYFYILEINKYT